MKKIPYEFLEIFVFKGGETMDENKEMLLFGKSTVTNKKTKKHTPSTIQADTLFTFTSELDYLIAALKSSMLSPRYCEEDIRYLRITNLKKIAYPMKCFCDINLHRLGIHLEWYGYYGLAFSKEWGMNHGIQPIQYINPNSELRKDFIAAFSAAIKSDPLKENQIHQKMKNFLLHEMMYYKPYEGMMKNRNTGKRQKKCFTDECEWRFIPDVTILEYEQAYYDQTILNSGGLVELSNSMIGKSEISLQFNYSDLKYIIIKTIVDFEKLTDEISALKLDEIEKNQLISKIIIWDKSKEDF